LLVFGVYYVLIDHNFFLRIFTNFNYNFKNENKFWSFQVLFWLISGFVKFIKNDNYMNRPEKLLSADNCSHYKTMGWVTPRFSVHIKRDTFCQLPRKWSSIDSTVGDLPYSWLRVGSKGLRFSSAAEYRPIL
jgi:hypothetical protein